MIRTYAFLLPLAACIGWAADAPSIGKVYDGQLSSVEREVVSLVEAMPADKLNFAPTQGEFKGVRTFAQQAKHIAAVNYMVAAAALGKKAPVDTGGESGPESVATKEQVVKFLKESFAFTHEAMLSLTAQNEANMIPSPFGQGQMARVGAANVALWHTFDHYGQMVVYARMNGVVPPASR